MESEKPPKEEMDWPRTKVKGASRAQIAPHFLWPESIGLHAPGLRLVPAPGTAFFLVDTDLLVLQDAIVCDDSTLTGTALGPARCPGHGRLENTTT